MHSASGTAQHARIEVAVRPLIAAAVVVPPGRGSSTARRTADDAWERARESETFVVEVTVTNATPRAYRLKVAAISLRTDSGERVKPLDPTEDSPQPVLTDQTLAPGARVQGYLAYPLGTYTGAAGYVIEEPTQANEGFSVQF